MKTLTFLIFTALTVAVSAQYGWIETIGEDVTEYLKTGKINSNLEEALDMLRLRSPLTNKSKFKPLDIKLLDVLKPEEKGVVTCTICRTFVDSAVGWMEEGLSPEELVDRLSGLCVDLGISTDRVCRGTITSNLDIGLWIYSRKNESATPLTPRHICGFALYPECPLDEELFDWQLDLDFLGPKPTPDSPQLPPEGSPSIKVLQFTDVHVDPNYRPGYNAECGEPMCCRFDQGIPENSSAAAGYWGDYRDCDMPLHTFQNMLQHAAATHQDVAYVIFTGDIIDHGVWATSNQYNTDLLTSVQSEFDTYFPSVPLISIFGNHEAHPMNVFTDPRRTEIPEALRTTWLYELAADLWRLPQEARPDILAGGMFSIEVTPGLQIIGINTMFCYNYNWWLMYDNVDPAGELIWLSNQLLQLEQQGKKAHILGHHPAGRSDCMHFWSKQYRRIINRFENTVVSQFHGHTHNDHFSIFYDLDDPSRATSVAFDAGSGTPYSDVNPNYRTYTVDPVSFRVLDHETWSFNLTAANLAGETESPNWQSLYSFKQAYNVPSLFPSDLDELVKIMAVDPVLQQQYFRFYMKDGDTGLAEGCDDACLEDLVCDIVVTVANDKSKCNELFP